MDEKSGTGPRKRRGGHLYRCRAPVDVLTNYGPSQALCGGWLLRAYVRPGPTRAPRAIGWHCERCGTFIRGDDPLAEVDMDEGMGRRREDEYWGRQ